MDPQKNDLTEQEELKILGEILEAHRHTDRKRRISDQ